MKATHTLLIWLMPAALCMTASQALSQTTAVKPITSTELDWRDLPKPVIQKQERKHTPVNIKEVNNIEPIWLIEIADTTLSNTVSRWCRQQNWQLIWEADRDFPILATVYLKGSFESALDKVMRSLADTDYPLQAIMNPNTKVVRIVRHMQNNNL